MKAVEREKAIRLRIEDQLSYGGIAKRLKVAKSTLSRWLENLPLSDKRMLELRRNAWSKGEASREKFRQTMRAKREKREYKIYTHQKKKLTHISEESKFIAGLMLYAAEGEKKTRYDISFTNTDPVLVDFFAGWLEQFLDIKRQEMKIQLRLYENMNIAAEELFWMRALRLKRSQLCKSQVSPLRPKSFSYRDSVRHGTCRLYKCSGEKKAKLLLSIRAFFDTHKESHA